MNHGSITEHTGTCDRTLVSLVLAVRNEASTIESCLDSLLEQQDRDFDLEILIVDGDSTDRTREILGKVAARDSRVRIFRNIKRKTPFAFNLGLREARGEFVAILGAHTVYAKDYVSICLRELLAHDAAGCGGRVITSPADHTTRARLAAVVMSHPFGSSRKSFRTQREGFVDTVNYAIFRKDALMEAGGYNEQLYRNQDNDMNQRLRAIGCKLYCTWQTHCLYRPKGSIRDLLAYAYGNGFWNLLSFRQNPASMASRHFIPFLFLTALGVTGALALAGIFLPFPRAIFAAAPFAAILGLHLALGSASALQVGIRERWAGALWLPLAFLAFHLAYGAGTFRAIFKLAGSPASEGGRPDAEKEPLPRARATAS